MARLTSILGLLAAGATLVPSAVATCPVADVSAIAHSGDPVGEEIVHDNVTYYVTGEPSDTAVLYLTDIYGIQLELNKLLADSFGRAGYLTVAPDMFNGTPAEADLVDPNYDPTEFLARNNPDVIDPLLDNAIAWIKETYGVTKFVATGYCFGGRHSFRLLSEGRGVSASFAAHPSNLEDGEISAITGAVSVAAAETDNAMPPARRHLVEELLLATDQPYSLSLYGGTSHGFGVRGNVSDPQQKFGKEQAFFQAVRWFDSWA